MTTVLYSHLTDRITFKDVLFPICPRKNEKWTEMVKRRNNMQFHINDELLRSWIGWTNQVSGDFNIGFVKSSIVVATLCYALLAPRFVGIPLSLL